jgi:hypothetical protein
LCRHRGSESGQLGILVLQIGVQDGDLGLGGDPSTLELALSRFELLAVLKFVAALTIQLG